MLQSNHGEEHQSSNELERSKSFVGDATGLPAVDLDLLSDQRDKRGSSSLIRRADDKLLLLLGDDAACDALVARYSGSLRRERASEDAVGFRAYTKALHDEAT